jgi:hypothetical protein
MALDRFRAEEKEYLLVYERDTLLGVVCYRSIVHGLCELPPHARKDFLSMPVESLAETASKVHPTDTVDGVVERLEKNGYLVVGHERPLGIVTASKAMRYFQDQAAAYIFLREIELSIRYLVSVSTDFNKVRELAMQCLGSKYAIIDPEASGKPQKGSRPMPERLEEFDFADYKTIITSGHGWPIFRAAFGGMDKHTAVRLERIGGIRNDVFHFKREITPADMNELMSKRDWLMNRVMVMDNRKRSGGDQ